MLARHEVSAQSFREAMSRFGAAVNIVTSDGPEGRLGFTATAVCSLSADPPSLLVCMNRSSSQNKSLQANHVICVNTLTGRQSNLAAVFSGAGKLDMPARFGGATWLVLETGAPALAEALIAFDCRIAQAIETATHTLLVAEVVALGLGRWEVSDHLLDGRWVHVGEPAWDNHLTAELWSAIAIFHSFGAKVVLFTMPYVDPRDQAPGGLPWSENSPARAEAYNTLVRRVARADPRVVSLIDLNKMLSPGGAYAATLDGVDVRQPDGIHVSVAGGELLQRQILPAIDRIGMEDETAAGSTR